jgi:hypothetical protein
MSDGERHHAVHVQERLGVIAYTHQMQFHTQRGLAR